MMWRSVQEFTSAGAVRAVGELGSAGGAARAHGFSAMIPEDVLRARLAKCLRLLTLFWTGLLAGWFWTFDLAVMPGFGRIAAAEAGSAMAGIDAVVQGSTLFGVVLFGAALLHAATAFEGLLVWRHLSGRLCFAAAALFLLGAVLPTVMATAPLGEMLAAAAPGDLAWETYGPPWDAWNGLRAMSAIGSFLILAVVVVFETPERREAPEPIELPDRRS